VNIKLYIDVHVHGIDQNFFDKAPGGNYGTDASSVEHQLEVHNTL